MRTRLLRDWMNRLVSAVFIGLAALPLAAEESRSEWRSYALVQPDASLKVAGRHVRLWGIYIPYDGEYCASRQRPIFCGSRAATALEGRIQEFVTCWPRYQQGRIYVATCRVGYNTFNAGEDLAAYLLRNGWAVAAPDAPFEYVVLERIARRRGFGIWGFRVDSVR